MKIINEQEQTDYWHLETKYNHLSEFIQESYQKFPNF